MGIRLNEIDRNCKNELFNDNNNNNHHNKSSLILPKIVSVKNFPAIKEYTNNNIFQKFYTQVNEPLSNKEILNENAAKNINRKFSGLKREKGVFNNNNLIYNENENYDNNNNNNYRNVIKNEKPIKNKFLNNDKDKNKTKII